MAKWACDTIASKMYVDHPWPRAGCLLHAQYNRYALHCTQLKENPHKKKNTELCKFLQVMQKPDKAIIGEPYITDGDFVVGNITECS